MIKQVRIEIENAVNQIEFKVMFAVILLISLISILLNCFQDYGRIHSLADLEFSAAFSERDLKRLEPYVEF